MIKQKLKILFFRLLGKDPEAVVVSFLTGPPEKAAAMLDEIRRLLPERRHFAVGLREPAPVPGVTSVVLPPAGAWELGRALRRQFRRYRIGMAAVLFTAEPEFRALRLAAFLLAPTRVLAYNARLERHHLRLRTWIASLLFLKGVPLDRIFLRPRWLFPFRRERSDYPTHWQEIPGRKPLPDRPRIAVVSPYLPWPLSHGGAVRIYHLLREAARHFEVFLFAFTEEEAAPCGPLAELCAGMLLVRKPRYREPRWATWRPPEACEYDVPLMHRALREYRRRWQIELVQVEYTHLASYPGDILTAHDITADLYAQLYRLAPSWSNWWNWRRWRWFEHRALGRYRRVVVMSEKDAAWVAGARTAVIPNGVDLERFRPTAEPDAQRVLFVGSFRHFPNAAAYRWLCEQIWPRVRERLPAAELTVVAGPNPELYWREHTGAQQVPRPPGVTLLGFVSDVRPLYEAANLVVAPTPVSAGTNLKVLEAMAMQRAVVSTSSGCAGLGLEHGRSVWIADQPEAFADAVADLLLDPERRRSLALQARALAEARYDWRIIGERQARLWRELLAEAFEIRAARRKDLAAIARIQAASPQAACWPPEDYLRQRCQVAELRGAVAGFVAWRELAAGEAEILNLAVDPMHRRRGVATRLLEPLLARRQTTWYLEVRESNAAARALYGKMGFREVGRRSSYYQDTGEAAVVMRRDSC